MHNIFLLLKNNFNIMVGRLAGKKQRKSTAVATAMLILFGVGLFVLYTLQAYTMFKGFSQVHAEKLAVFHAILTSISVIVIIGLMRTQANVKFNDTDFLMSLPIKKHEIILAKTFSKYLFDLFFVTLLLLPYIVLYQVFAGINYSVLFLGLLLTLLLPLVSVAISYIVDFIVNRLFNKTRIGSLLKSFFIILLFVFVMGLMLIKTCSYGMALNSSLEEYFADRVITNYLLNFLFAPNIVNCLVVILSIFAIFALGIILYTINFGKTFASYSAINKTLKFTSPKSTLSMLYKKELYTYANTPAYIINTIIGAIVLLVLSIYIATMGYSGITKLFGMELPKNLIVGVLAVAFGALCATSPISASAISLEGKNMWLLKSSPINERQLFTSKVLVHLSIIQLPLLVASTLVSIFLKLNLIECIAMFIMPTLMNFIVVYGGLLINLWQPVLDFDDETKVVKQSLAVLITMLGGMVLSIVPIILYKTTTLSLKLIFMITSGFYALLLAIIIILLYTVGVKMFRKIS